MATDGTVEIVTLTKQEYDNLMDEINFLNCLRQAGVDNWEGYSDACEMYAELG
jgi:hypothetical protein